ncbi:iron ABC transporter permease [Halobacterium salinarum]|uniref:Thiamine transport system permease protein n=8 Tax=Halobacterium salinarum TaxID=2242 RepID=A0A841HB98_HALSI|nr:iron ABC transporter permease [Halobacterium salinarum]AAG20487.1 sulfate transport system permease protein [Halobacterium salinarum NRC-1]MBB6089582.1 thiamine transport system permease protein [Halobacterium salinarum]MDL0118466.1 iron ABC transporter permease [Halobacterium salinarum]MDL0131662.1 iron ABC transporter permease [Halobacterium salinarum]MDL0138518.1 iron ABC transporter permease [Halobacterium salinarum]
MRRQSGVSVVDRYAVPAAGVATLAVLAVVFYYPVGTVFAAALGPDNPVVAVLTSEFYMGAAHGVFAHPLSVPGDVAAWAHATDVRVGWSGWLPAITVVHPGVSLGLVGFTAYQAVLSTVASVALGLPGAYVLARFEFPGRRTLRSLTILPFVLPSIMVVVGFVATFGQHGTVNDALAALGVGRVQFLYTLQIVVVAHAFYNAPLVTRMVASAWETVDASAVETARSLGASPLRAFRDVVVPQLVPAIAASALLTFVFTFMSFPIVLALGGLKLATVEVWLYARIQQFDYGTAAALATLETGLSLALMYVYLRYEGRQSAASAGGRSRPRKRLLGASGGREWALRLAGVGYAVVVAVVFVAPVVSMVAASVGGVTDPTLRWWRFLGTRQASGRTQPATAVWYSIVFGVGALAVALPMGVVVGAFSARGGRGRRLADAALMAPVAVSGVVVGFGLLQSLAFGVDIAGTRVQLVGPLVVVCAHAIAGYPFVVRNVAPMLAAVDSRVVESARALGASRGRALWDVELPLVWPGVVAGAAFAFAISIGEFDSTVILANESVYTMPVALKRFLIDRTAGPSTGPAAAMGTVLLVVTAASFVVIDRVGGRYQP